MAQYVTCILYKHVVVPVFSDGVSLCSSDWSRACFSFPSVAMTGGSPHVYLKGPLLTLDLISIAAGLQQARHL